MTTMKGTGAILKKTGPKEKEMKKKKEKGTEEKKKKRMKKKKIKKKKWRFDDQGKSKRSQFHCYERRCCSFSWSTFPGREGHSGRSGLAETSNGEPLDDFFVMRWNSCSGASFLNPGIEKNLSHFLNYETMNFWKQIVDPKEMTTESSSLKRDPNLNSAFHGLTVVVFCRRSSLVDCHRRKIDCCFRRRRRNRRIPSLCQLIFFHFSIQHCVGREGDVGNDDGVRDGDFSVRFRCGRDRTRFPLLQSFQIHQFRDKLCSDFSNLTHRQNFLPCCEMI